MQVQSGDVPMIEEGARGSFDLAPAPEQAQAQELADTPVKVQLRREVGQLWDAPQHEETNVHNEIHEIKVDSYSKVKVLLTDQWESFQRTAGEYEQQAKDICQKAVAETRANIHSEAVSAINDREHQLKEERNKLNKLRSDLVQARSHANYEASYKNEVIKEAENAIQKQRSEILNQAEQTIRQQGSLVKQEFSGLALKVKSAETS